MKRMTEEEIKSNYTVITIDDACKKYSITKMTLWRWVRAKKFQVYKASNRRVLVDSKGIENWVRIKDER